MFGIAAIMRSFSTLQEKVIPFLSVTLPKLTEKLQMVAKNPSKPHFNHYLFETFSLAIRYCIFCFQNNVFNGIFLFRIVCTSNPAAVTSFEDILFPIFQGILTQDIQGNCFTNSPS